MIMKPSIHVFLPRLKLKEKKHKDPFLHLNSTETNFQFWREKSIKKKASIFNWT